MFIINAYNFNILRQAISHKMTGKKIIILAAALTFLAPQSYPQFTHLGVAAGYGTQIKEPGFGAYGVFSANEQIKIVPNAMFYLPHKISTQDGTQKFGWWTISVDGEYMIINQGAVLFYGVLGLTFLNITGEQDEVISGQEFKDKISLQKLGLDIGAGVRFPVSEFILPFIEAKYILGSAADFEFNKLPVAQFSLTAGIMFRINEPKPRGQQED